MAKNKYQLTRREMKALENVTEKSRNGLGVWELASDKDISLKDAYKLLDRLEKEKAVFGEKVKEVLEMGAVSLLLISVDKIKDYENILDLAEKMKVKIMVISDEHQSGEKLLRMGGIGGLLRYKIKNN